MLAYRLLIVLTCPWYFEILWYLPTFVFSIYFLSFKIKNTRVTIY